MTALNVSVDLVVVRLGPDGIQFLAPPRQADPFAGQRALPGVLLLPGETPAQAARRALVEKTSVSPDEVHLVKSSFFGEPGRDPRTPTLSVSYLAIVPPETQSPDWESLPLDSTDTTGAVHGLAFDHDEIIKDSFERLGTALLSDIEVSRALLGEKFSTREVALAYGSVAVVLGRRFGPSNIPRTLFSHPSIATDGRSASRGKSGQPRLIYVWKDAS